MWKLAERIGGWAEPDWDGDDTTYVVGQPFTPLNPEGLHGWVWP